MHHIWLIHWWNENVSCWQRQIHRFYCNLCAVNSSDYVRETGSCCKLDFNIGLLNSIVWEFGVPGWHSDDPVPHGWYESAQGWLAHSWPISQFPLETTGCQKPQRDQHLCGHSQPLAPRHVALKGRPAAAPHVTPVILPSVVEIGSLLFTCYIYTHMIANTWGLIVLECVSNVHWCPSSITITVYLKNIGCLFQKVSKNWLLGGDSGFLQFYKASSAQLSLQPKQSIREFLLFSWSLQTEVGGRQGCSFLEKPVNTEVQIQVQEWIIRPCLGFLSFSDVVD